MGTHAIDALDLQLGYDDNALAPMFEDQSVDVVQEPDEFELDPRLMEEDPFF